MAAGWIRALDPTAETGGSQPHLFETNDGKFMVKAANNPQGQRVLSNELVGGLCLDWLGIHHPRSAVVDLPQDVIDDSPGAKFIDGTPLAAGLAFGSEYWQSDPQGTVGIDQIANAADVAGLSVADTWIRNHDGRQYRVRAISEEPGRYEAFPVDQGHSFGPDWTVDSLDADRAVVLQQPIKPVDADLIAPFLLRLHQFSEDIAASIVAEVPDGWLTCDERSALQKYLVERAKLAVSTLETHHGVGRTA